MAKVSLLDILGQPAWQGAGAIIAVSALIAYIWIEGRRRRRKSAASFDDQGEIEHFLLTDETSKQRYYEKLAACIRNAEDEVYRTGRGFDQDRKSSVYSALIAAEEAALAPGHLQMTRIQLDGTVSASWAAGYAHLAERYPENFRMVADLDNFGYIDVTLIDPRGRRPVVNFLYERRRPAKVGMVSRGELGLIATGASARAIAASQLDLIEARLPQCLELRSKSVLDLARTYTYFGWGVHMAPSKMLHDAPGARLRGTAILHGWKRDIAAMLAGPADRDTIGRTGNPADSFDGVAYDLSWWDKHRLDRTESRAYEEVDVEIEIDGHVHKAFTYVPLPPATANSELTPDSWIGLVIEGAVKNKMTRLLAELQAAGVRIEGLPHGTL